MTTTGADTDTTIPEPALVTTLVDPLLRLRAALGDGARPDAPTLAALAAIPATIAASDEPHRLGATGLEAAQTAVAAVPAITRTRNEVAAVADTTAGLGATLADAYATRDSAAAKLDTLIADFRSRATPLVNTARSQADLDAVVDLAADYIRDGVSVVQTANGEMDTHTGKVNILGGEETAPRVSVPSGFRGDTGTWGDKPASTPAGTYNTPTLTYTPPTATTTDPVLAAQNALQTALINGGVTLGTSLIDAGVSVGTHLIDTVASVITHAMDKGTEVATTGIDALATVGTTAVTQAINPNANNGNGNGGGGLFGGLGAGAPTGPGGNDDPAPEDGASPDIGFNLGPGLDAGPEDASPAPSAPYPSAPTYPDLGGGTDPAPAPSAGLPTEDTGTGGAAVPPPIAAKPTPTEQDRPRRDGQAGVTATA
ncbi:hypothetical protein [Nocardia sp. CC201C]|uniref:hypothetical protein n=1 Tax=Nocardia sp. CC201C TaxID=3044575 RepID=UPI0024A88477|nr:hypothetical protein [Nocardia sp. CC201C]